MNASERVIAGRASVSPVLWLAAHVPKWLFRKIRGPILGGPIRRILVYQGNP